MRFCKSTDIAPQLVGAALSALPFDDNGVQTDA